jgi:glycine cleavage system H lipoate-binding protein/ABC-type phosphate transport system substrate-binding protein
MKTQFYIFIALLLFSFIHLGNNKLAAQETATKNITVRIASTPDLYQLTSQWAAEFSRTNPQINVTVLKLTENHVSGMFKTDASLGFVSSENMQKADINNLWKMEVAKDALVPVINSKNPFLNELQTHNVSPEIIAQILLSPQSRQWNLFPKSTKKGSINYYMVNNDFDKTMIANFLKAQKPIDGISHENYDNMLAAIQNDPYAIGFCRLSHLVNSKVPNLDKTINLMPIDKNGNGKIDDFENVYTNLQGFLRKVWIGHFPNELSASIYTVANQVPANQAEREFLKWVTSSGQRLLNDNGYCTLVPEQKQANMAMLGFNKQDATAAVSPTLFARIGQFFGSISASQYGFALLILLLVALGIYLNIPSKEKSLTVIKTNTSSVFNENSILAPSGLYFDKTHTWTYMEKDGKVRIGIDDFLQHVTGPLTKVKMKSPGDIVKKGETIVSIMQNGKQLNINSPVSGTIIAQNETLISNPSAINNSPYSEGWMYMIEPSNWLREIQFFTMSEKYSEWIKNEFVRLKDFLSVKVNQHTPAYATIALQDGGELTDNVLANLGPEIWEEFQTTFIDTMK